ncbi:MAG TPA: aminotransferase class V-fold PLP-dependent enzyme [Jatrophihabitantaceae bacterium]|nr:aminotransferase class V-fold PLP-dependent enzyme [Jatrophihabitantaceae bacterium]
MTDPLLAYVANRVSEYQRGAGERPVTSREGVAELAAMVGGPLPDGPTDPAEAVRQLADAVDAGSVATIGPRYFGFVTGGAYPATVAADWLATGADQNVAVYVMSPVGAVVEDVAAGWLRDIFGLPRDASAGFTTGAMMANFTGLAAARHHVLAKAGWDVEADGLQGAPRVHVVVGAERHATIDVSLRYLGLGHGTAHVVPADEQGRLRADLVAGVLADCDGPTIVCAQAGNVNSGGFDPIAEICELAQAHGAWVHVDAAFGLWAAASPSLRGLVAGIDQADSWATDAHKWLNVPYDSGLVFVAHPDAHRAAMRKTASYLGEEVAGLRDGDSFVPESSRRARGLAVWAALRTLGRSGIADLVDRCCALARRFAEQLAAVPGVEVLNDVVLNQVVVRFGDSDDTTRRVIAAAQADGTSWFGGTVWRGVAAARISVSNWSTTEADVDRSVAAIRGVLDRITSRA